MDFTVTFGPNESIYGILEPELVCSFVKHKIITFCDRVGWLGDEEESRKRSLPFTVNQLPSSGFCCRVYLFSFQCQIVYAGHNSLHQNISHSLLY